MEVFILQNIFDLPDLDTNSCTIGNFDGIHKGHKNLIIDSKVAGYKQLVITFENINKNKIITNTNQKIAYLEQLDVDYLLIIPFEVIKKVFYNEFIQILKILKVKYLTCGADFRFGYKREGDIIDLKKHFKLTVVEDYKVNDIRVSSKLIKKTIEEGDLDFANELLEKPYTIVGKVVKGNQIGRKLGFPTANIEYNEYILPKKGVYFTVVTYKETKYLAMTNIGNNPTLNEQEKTRLEVHILDFNNEIYNEELSISFVKYLRDERKYNSKEELIASLNETINICREYEDMIK